MNTISSSHTEYKETIQDYRRYYNNTLVRYHNNIAHFNGNVVTLDGKEKSVTQVHTYETEFEPLADIFNCNGDLLSSNIPVSLKEVTFKLLSGGISEKNDNIYFSILSNYKGYQKGSHPINYRSGMILDVCYGVENNIKLLIKNLFCTKRDVKEVREKIYEVDNCRKYCVAITDKYSLINIDGFSNATLFYLDKAVGYYKNGIFYSSTNGRMIEKIRKLYGKNGK